MTLSNISQLMKLSADLQLSIDLYNTSHLLPRIIRSNNVCYGKRIDHGQQFLKAYKKKISFMSREIYHPTLYEKEEMYYLGDMLSREGLILALNKIADEHRLFPSTHLSSIDRDLPRLYTRQRRNSCPGRVTNHMGHTRNEIYTHQTYNNSSYDWKLNSRTKIKQFRRFIKFIRTRFYEQVFNTIHRYEMEALGTTYMKWLFAEYQAIKKKNWWQDDDSSDEEDTNARYCYEDRHWLLKSRLSGHLRYVGMKVRYQKHKLRNIHKFFSDYLHDYPLLMYVWSNLNYSPKRAVYDIVYSGPGFKHLSLNPISKIHYIHKVPIRMLTGKFSYIHEPREFQGLLSKLYLHSSYIDNETSLVSNCTEGPCNRWWKTSIYNEEAEEIATKRQISASFAFTNNISRLYHFSKCVLYHTPPVFYHQSISNYHLDNVLEILEPIVVKHASENNKDNINMTHHIYFEGSLTAAMIQYVRRDIIPTQLERQIQIYRTTNMKSDHSLLRFQKKGSNDSTDRVDSRINQWVDGQYQQLINPPPSEQHVRTKCYKVHGKNVDIYYNIDFNSSTF